MQTIVMLLNHMASTNAHKGYYMSVNSSVRGRCGEGNYPVSHQPPGPEQGVFPIMLARTMSHIKRKHPKKSVVCKSNMGELGMIKMAETQVI